ncbi:MAG: ATP-binding protein [Oculatellaceae cyanobacterium bins.114]|nr:ATP-binding protein [Oculatellaceae cyanobacterium bins.114]
MIKTKAIANRTAELQLFSDIVCGNHSAKILLIQADSGMGKSDLLKKFQDSCPSEALVVPLDLKGADLGIPYFFNWVCEDLGYDRFQQFTAELRQMVSGAINFANNQMEGQQTIQIALNVDENTRRYRLGALQRAFFQDLAAIQQRVVILLDTFQLAVSDLQNWIESELLRMVPRLPNLVVVVAGQTVPDCNNIGWGSACESCYLEAIEQVEAWYQLAQVEHLPFDRDVIKAIVRLNKGNPLEIRKALKSLERGWSNDQ